MTTTYFEIFSRDNTIFWAWDRTTGQIICKKDTDDVWTAANELIAAEAGVIAEYLPEITICIDCGRENSNCIC